METTLQFLLHRYPRHFSLSPDKATFVNKILGTEQDLRSKHPLHVLMETVPEDFVIMLRDPQTGRYHLRAGVICSAIGWNIGLIIGQGLPEIHTPVPFYKERLQYSMERYKSIPNPVPFYDLYLC